MWKIFGVVGVIGLMVLIGCKTPPPVGHPLSEGDGLPHPTSPRPSPGGEGVELPRPAATPSQRGTDSPAMTGTPSQRGRDSIREYYERMELLELLYSEMDFEGDK